MPLPAGDAAVPYARDMFRGALFEDRVDGGRKLAGALARFRDVPCVVYGLPRGGVITAREVALALDAPLDALITRKLTHPQSPEYAIGAISDDGEYVVNEVAVGSVPEHYLAEERARRMAEAVERRAKYLQTRPPIPIEGKTALIVDDGIATGYTMKAAILAIRKRHPAKVIVAAPVAPPDVFEEFKGLADEVVVPYTPEGFYAIGAYYRDFAPVDDGEVVAALTENADYASKRAS